MELLLAQGVTPAQKHIIVFDSAVNEIKHTLSVYGVDTDIDHLGQGFFDSEDYRTIKKFSEEVEAVINNESYVEKRGKEVKVSSFSQVVNFLMDDAKKGQSFQRYKGLGEMMGNLGD